MIDRTTEHSMDYAFPLKSNQTDADVAFCAGMQSHFVESSGTSLDKLRNCPRFVPRQAIATFLAKREVFMHVLGIHGAFIECRVFIGGLFTWTQLSAVY